MTAQERGITPDEQESAAFRLNGNFQPLFFFNASSESLNMISTFAQYKNLILSQLGQKPI